MPSQPPFCATPHGPARRRRTWLSRTALATAVVMAVTAVPETAAAPPAAAALSGGAAAAGAVQMGGGTAGQISEQSGAFAAALPLAALPGRGGAGVNLALAYDQTAAAAGTDRFALGAGISLGKVFVDPDSGGTLHTASGGTYALDPRDTAGTGLKRYLLKDLTFRDKPGTLPLRDGLEDVPREYRWVLTYSDGRTNYFSTEGNLVAEEDIFGSQTAYAWDTRDGQHRLEKAVDAWGQAVTFDYSHEDQVTVTSPARSDGQQPRTVLRLDAGRLTSVTYPENQKVQLAWDYTPQDQPGRLLTRVEAPTGAVTRISYSQPHGFPIASSLKVTDQAGKNLAAERTFRLEAQGEHAGHDFTGRGQYTSPDSLFDSADADYRYATELSDGRSTVRSVYNSLHLLKERTALLHHDGELKPVRTQSFAYAGEQQDGQAPPPASALPANYSKPVRASVTVHDPATGRSRTTTETARFDDYGRETERTSVTGAKTVTAYDAPATALPEDGEADTSGEDSSPAGYSLPLRVTVTGSDGARTITENTLTGDRKSIASTTQLVQNTGETRPSARTATAFQANAHGEITRKTVTWAPGARPNGAQGPDEITETYHSSTDTSARTRTVTVNNAAGASSQVTDLVTGQVIRATDPLGRTAETAYDSAGRAITQQVPAGADRKLRITASYTPTSVTLTAPGADGKPHITVEEHDLLGRAVRTTDNVSGGKLTGDPAARTLQSVQFEDEGRTAKVTDQAGRTTVTAFDDLGRPVKTTTPNGVTQLTLYTDAATADTSAVTTLTLPAGKTSPADAVTTATATADHAGRPVDTRTSFADGTQLTGTRTSYDSLGRLASTVSQDLALTPSYGPPGTPDTAALTPQAPGTFPGQHITAARQRDLAGAQAVKTLTPGQDTEASRSGTTLIRDAAGRITEERRPDGKKTTYTYTPGGQVKESISPGGTRTSYQYDPHTGQVLQTTVTSADGTAAHKTAYTYDPHTGQLTGICNPDDRPGTLISYTYDADGHITQTAYPDGTAIRQQYTDTGQLQKTTDAAGLTTFYTYNPDGTTAKAVQHERDDTQSPVKASVAYTYDSLGRVTKTDRGNGVVTETAFTAAHQISQEKTTRNGTPLTTAAYTYDTHGNLTQRTDTRPEAGADGTPGPPASTTTRYTYDAFNRLTSTLILDADGHKLTSVRYTHNVSGDITLTETTPHTGPQAGKTTATTHTVDTSGRLAALTTGSEKHTQAFDTEGRLTTAHDGTAWTYTLHGQPQSVTAPDGTATRYTYWADGTRATATRTTPSDNSTATPEHTTAFYYAPGGTLANDTHTTAGQHGTTTASYLLAGTRHARTLTGPAAQPAAATGAGYLITDRHGNTTALTDSNSGQTTQAWQYTDYGQPAAPSGLPLTPGTSGTAAQAGAARQPFTFAGEYTDPAGTQYLKTRLYDPATGRFTTPDPAPRHNRYQAMGANPVNRIDPQGTTEIPDWGSWLIWGATTAAAIGSFAAALLTTGPFSIGIGLTLIGGVLDVASAALEGAAIATGRNQLEDPLSIASLTLGAAGLALGAGGIFTSAKNSSRLRNTPAQHSDDGPAPLSPDSPSVQDGAPAPLPPAPSAPAPAPAPAPAAPPAAPAPAPVPAAPVMPTVPGVPPAMQKAALAYSEETAHLAHAVLMAVHNKDLLGTALLRQENIIDLGDDAWARPAARVYRTSANHYLPPLLADLRHSPTVKMLRKAYGKIFDKTIRAYHKAEGTARNRNLIINYMNDVQWPAEEYAREIAEQGPGAFDIALHILQTN
ncbi:RHS repeat-associated core domain-containing protein [Streptomyces sp. NPDC096030]|uniref:RHS repeat-associated core domain-containing protein n=1 Tax=Streptomyces sp. NPDC096030 TaxID=3155423 RepID=UPI00331FC2BC